MWRIKNDTASVRPKYSNSSLQKYPKMEKKFHPDEEKKIVIKTSSPFSERVVGHHFGSGLAMKKIIEFPSPKVGHLAFVSCNHLLKGLIFEPTGMMREQLSMTFKRNTLNFYTINGYVLFICGFLSA